MCAPDERVQKKRIDRRVDLLGILLPVEAQHCGMAAATSSASQQRATWESKSIWIRRVKELWEQPALSQP